jgi:hypothetical protein
MSEDIQNGIKTMICKIEPIDIIAVVIIIGALWLKYCGADGVVSSTLIMVVAYYFGKKSGVLPNLTNNNKDQ